ncbi:C6 transcription factor [Aspergillus luchuensis]|uniref:C6 transcription factor n=1 Tax=Aspergillus kawachii TaxID=1069201 RepID=A0A146FJ41_ASPKA|nr:C6 transcription factor [Aspergillus luchuensis]
MSDANWDTEAEAEAEGAEYSLRLHGDSTPTACEGCRRHPTAYPTEPGAVSEGDAAQDLTAVEGTD